VVEDAEAAGDALGRLGFTVSPISRLHNIGVANRMVLLQPSSPGAANFLEVMAVTDESAVPALFRPHLIGRRGYRWIVTSGPDVRDAFAKLTQADYAFAPPVAVNRDWVLPDGEVLHVGFDVLLPIEAPLPFNFCAYRTREHYVRPEFMAHANGARTLSGVLCLTPNPEEFLAYFERLFGTQRQRFADGLFSISPRHVALIVGTQAAWRRALGRQPVASDGSCLFGCRIEVAERSRTRACLSQAGIAIHESDLGLIVDSPLRDGSVLIFD
jgi:hypothetical protein